MSKQGDLPPGCEGDIIATRQDGAGGARADSEQSGAELAPSLEHSVQSGSCQAVPMDTGWMGRHLTVSLSTHQFGRVGSGAGAAPGHGGEGCQETLCLVPSEGNECQDFHTQTPGSCSSGPLQG